MPSPSDQVSHSRTQSLLLINKLLDSRENASPFTLIIDSLEQPARPLINEYIRRAKTLNGHIISVSSENLHPQKGVNTFIRAYEHDHASVTRQIKSAITAVGQSKTLLIFDTVHRLTDIPNINLPSYLSALLSPTTSLIATYHSSRPSPSPTTLHQNSYSPAPLTVLRHLATAIIRTQSLPHFLAQRHARLRSLPPPAIGLSEDEEGILQGMGSCDRQGIVLELEHRRKSGRAVGDLFYLHTTGASRRVVLLQDHPAWRSSEADSSPQQNSGQEDGEAETTFSLALTERQKRAREGVMLPYYDAQKTGVEGGGEGEGGRILYDMGVEDDFDEEEDEI